MKWKVIAVLLLVTLGILGTWAIVQSADSKVGADCTYKGIKLHGRVQIVDALPDLKIEIVNALPDLRVKKVTALPNSCGEWEFVDALPDFKVQIVNALPDLRIEYVDALPGLP